jgi:hypothetical protein
VRKEKKFAGVLHNRNAFMVWAWHLKADQAAPTLSTDNFSERHQLTRYTYRLTTHHAHKMLSNWFLTVVPNCNGLGFLIFSAVRRMSLSQHSMKFVATCSHLPD